MSDENFRRMPWVILPPFAFRLYRDPPPSQEFLVESLGVIEKFPRLAAWRDALLATAAVKGSTVPNIEAAWQENLILRKRWLGQFVSKSVLGASAAA